MTIGLKVWDGAGNVLLDTTTITARLIDTFDVAAGVSDSRSNAAYAGAIALAVAKASDIVFPAPLPHGVSLSGTTLYYTAKDATTASRIIVVVKT